MSDLSRDYVVDLRRANILKTQRFFRGRLLRRGLIERPASAPRGYYRSARAIDIPLIPMDNWPGLIADGEKNLTRLSDIRNTGDGGQPIRSYDQNGQGYCATADTEVLTQKGFVPYPEYDWATPVGTVNQVTHALEFQAPIEKHVYEYKGPMIYSTNRRLDFGVTPDHQMYVRKWNEQARTLSSDYSFVRAGDLGWYSGFMHAPSGQIGTDFVEIEVPSDRRYDGDDFIAILGLIVSDGYAGGSDNTKNWVSFASFRPEAREAVSALATRTGFHEVPSRPGVWIRYDAGALASWLRENAYTRWTGAHAKRVPDFVKYSSTRQIKHFLQWFDDRNRTGTQFYSVSKKLIDDLQELFLRIGKRTSIGTRPAKTVPFAENKSGVIRSGSSFVLTVGQEDSLSIDKKKHIETETYDGLVYCAGVPNHTLITRRNGSVLISSNCWSYSPVSGLTLLRAIGNQPHVRLSAHAVACRIKNFRDEGGWGALALDFLMESGVPPEALWPAQSMNRKYDTPEVWAAAADYRVLDGWIDLVQSVYDRNLSIQQTGTLLLSNVPVVIDLNHMAHSMLGMDLVDAYPSRRATDPRRYGVRFWNEWGDEWGAQGTAVFVDNLGWPDGAVAPLTASFT